MVARRIALGAVVAAVAALLLIQLVPYGRRHTNPPVQAEPAWDSPATRAAAVTACFDCHSNETAWPWYSNVAPVSWLLQRHVDEGREKLNFSLWGKAVHETDEIVEQVQEGKMPPWDYVLLHPEARLAGPERTAFLAGLTATFGRGRGDGGEGARSEGAGEREREGD